MNTIRLVKLYLILSVFLVTGCLAEKPFSYRAKRPLFHDVNKSIEFAVNLNELSSLEDHFYAEQNLDWHLKKKPDYRLNWLAAKTCFWVSSKLKNKDQRIRFAEKGMAYAQKARIIEPQRVEAIYYYMLNLAKRVEAKNQLAKIKTLLRLAKEAEAINPNFDHAGPLVFQAKLYLEAPAWPISVGDSEKAIPLLQRALMISKRPLTYLFYAQALIENDENMLAKDALERALSGKLSPRWRKEANQLLDKLK